MGMMIKKKQEAGQLEVSRETGQIGDTIYEEAY